MADGFLGCCFGDSFISTFCYQAYLLLFGAAVFQPSSCAGLITVSSDSEKNEGGGIFGFSGCFEASGMQLYLFMVAMWWRVRVRNRRWILRHLTGPLLSAVYALLFTPCTHINCFTIRPFCHSPALFTLSHEFSIV